MCDEHLTIGAWETRNDGIVERGAQGVAFNSNENNKRENL